MQQSQRVDVVPRTSSLYATRNVILESASRHRVSCADYDAYPIADFLELCQDVGFTVAHYERVNLPDGARDKGRIGVVLQRS